MFRLRVTLAALLCVGLVACSDDNGKTTDSRVPDHAVPDQVVADTTAVDQAPATEAGSDMSAQQRSKAATIELIKYLANALPSSTTTNKVETYIPASNAVPGWVEDTTVGKPGVESGYDKLAIEGIIDGSHDPYDKEGCVGFAKQDYAMGTFKLSLFLWQMKTSTGALNMLTKNKTDGETGSGLTFSEITGVKDRAIIADDIPQWRAYGYKGVYIYKILTQYI